MLIRIPDFVGPKDLKRYHSEVRDKGKEAAVAEVEIKKLKEGRSVQVLHVGPYDQEAPTIAKMKSFATAEGLSFRGLHHEIYLSDPRRVAPEKLRTILRYPVA